MSKDFDALPALVQITVNTHIGMLNTALPGRLVAYYVTGSAALGDFVEGRSDVDFVAVTGAPLKPEELERLRGVHAALENRRLFAGLDGSYVPADGFEGGRGAPDGCHRFNEGRYTGMKPFNIHSPDAWALKQYGVRAMGGNPESLPYTVDWDLLLEGMMQNLRTYWRGWIDGCRKFRTPLAIGLYIRPYATQWGVLGILRLYYTFLERDVASKTGAGNYALETLPAEWHDIVKEALRIRNGGAAVYRSKSKRRKDALAFMDFTLRECERVYQAK